MLKAYAYLRVSGKGQVEGDGFHRQREAVQKYAAAHGIGIVGEFREEGVTGTADGPDRPAWIDMVAAMLNSGVEAIVVEKLDRLARHLGIQEYMVYDMRKRGISILSACEDDLDDADPSRVMFRQMMGAVAQYEKSMIVLKLRAARQRKKAATGRCEGAKPYGHYDNERPMLDYILQLRDEFKFSANAISERLNEGGATPRSGKKWHPYVVTSILRAHRRVA